MWDNRLRRQCYHQGRNRALTEAIKAGFAELSQALSGVKDPPVGSSFPAMSPVGPSYRMPGHSNAGYTVPSNTPMTPSMPPAPTVPAAPAMPSAPAMPGSAVLFVDYACKEFRLLQWGISCFQCPLGMRQFVSQVWQVSLNLPFQGCVLVDGLQSLKPSTCALVEFV